MAEEQEAELLGIFGEDEGGPVKSFLEHLEDLRWVLIKSVAAAGIAVLICLIAGNYVVEVLRWPLKRAKISYPGTNQFVTLFFGTNQLGVFPVAPADESQFKLGTNRFV